ncbi:hypothetical protein [Chitinophaga sp. MM2321]|uniref:hypothetical protein n=1 Tax=Chitinophaga sp. MM2321 TaxID=3137178 RepID=UPI0032D5723D
MSLLSFQQALTDLIASPQLCVAARHNPNSTFAPYDLTLMERMRLRTAVFQKGMSVSCTLYRVNRITPIYTMLPYTCLLLGPQLVPLAEEFWQTFNRSDLQFKKEIELFAAFLQGKIRDESIQHPYLREILAMETAINELKFLPREKLLREEDHTGSLHPLIRTVPFDHEPEPLLYELSNMQVPAFMDSTGSYLLVIDYREEEMVFSTLPQFAEAVALNDL